MNRLLTVPEVAEFLNVHPNTVWTLIRSKELKSLKIRGSRRVTQDHLREYIEGIDTGNEGRIRSDV